MKMVLRGGRFVLQVAVVLALVGVVGVRPASARTADASHVISLVNSTRASVGLPPVRLDGGLSAVAQTWAGVMAAAGAIRHNPSLGAQIGGWTALAENVGMGGSVDIVHQVLVGSPSHYSNMTDSRFTAAGAGVVASGGMVFVVQVFMQGQGAPPPPPPPPAPAPVPAPEPEPAPAPVVVPEPAPRATPRVPEPVVADQAPPATVPASVAPAVAAPAPPTIGSDASPWMAVVFEQLLALDRAHGRPGLP